MFASWVRALGLIALSSSLAVGCGGSSKKIDVGGTCTLNSDCTQPLVCTLGKCHDACHTTADCPAGQSCITASDQSTVCESPTPCIYNSDCPTGLICAADLQCRQQCKTDVDCTPGQTCTTTKTCAEPSQVDSNKNLIAPDGGTSGGGDARTADAPVTQPDVPISGAGGMAGTGGAVGTGGGGGTGGVVGSGGATNSGGMAASGGTTSAGGTATAGGTTGSGGSGGAVGTGGAAGMGGVGDTGGVLGTGGTNDAGQSSDGGDASEADAPHGQPDVPIGGTGGAAGTGGVVGTGGAIGTGGTTNSGGTTTSGGTTSTGGNTSTGGATGSGGMTSTGGTTSGTSCGTSGLVCCGSQMCGANLTCTSQNFCECGGANQACCGGNACNSGLSCASDAGGPATCACGGLGARCCPGVDGGAQTCSGGTACSGSKCSCVAQFATAGGPNPYASGTYLGTASGVVLRTDGTVWASWAGATTPAFVEMNGTGGPLVATSIAISGPAGPSSMPPIGCAIVGGGVWCFPTGGTLTDSTDLGAGLGPTDATSSPVQVLTAGMGNPPLANVMQIAGAPPYDASWAYASFCATLTDGSAWCWGYGGNGQLGNGSTANASFASRVMANVSTPLSNVVEVRPGRVASCARKTDGSVWCWGTNTNGEIGVPPDTVAHSYYPMQVPFSVLDAGAQVATRLMADPIETFCAIMQDTSVVCWGYNYDGVAGAPDGSYVGPTSVLLAAGGSPLTGVVDLAGCEQAYGDWPYACAKTSDFAVLCWGSPPNYAGGPYPAVLESAAGTTVVGVVAPLSGDGLGIGYIDPNGNLVTGTATNGPVVPCTDLLP